MVDWIMYGKVQERKRKGLNKSQASRELGVDYKTILKYWDMTPDEYAADPFGAVDTYIYLGNQRKEYIQRCSEDGNIAPYSEKEAVLSWTLNCFNIGLLAKDLMLYAIAEKYVLYSQKIMTLFEANNKLVHAILNVGDELSVLQYGEFGLGGCVKSYIERRIAYEEVENTLFHTYYVLALYYKGRDDDTALEYLRNFSREYKKSGVSDFRQQIRADILRAEIEKNNFGEFHKEVILEDIRLISEYIGEESFWLLGVYKFLATVDSKDRKRQMEWQRKADIFDKKYSRSLNEAKTKLERYYDEVVDVLELSLG